MKTKKYIAGLALVLCTLSLCTSCNMDEQVYDRLDASVYYQSEASIKGAVAAIYGNAAMSYLEYFWYLNEFSADQVAWRVWNGGMWGYDEGEKTVISTHTWTAESKIIRSTWETAWSTIGLCNTLIADLERVDLAQVGITEDRLLAYISEVRTLRAWAYYNCFEIWGGAIPLYTSSNDGVIPPSADEDFQKGCQKVYDFICRELDECYPYLPQETGNNATRNRMNQAVNRIIKMRMLLNAQIFTGTPHFDDCATLAQELLDGKYGVYSLADDYRDIYHVTNNSCPEVVMAFAMENGQLNAGWMRDMPFLAYTYADYFDFSSTQDSWNCCCLVPSFDNSGTVNATYGYSENPVCFLDPPYNDRLGAVYERFSDKDIRKSNYKWENGNYTGIFLRGLQRAKWGTGDVLKADADRDGMDLYYPDQVGQFEGATTIGRALEPVMSPRWGQTNSGVRLVRYPIYPESEGKDFQDIDDVEFRWAEVYYTLAECKLRAGDAATAEQLVYEVRKRYFTNEADAKNYGRISTIDEAWMLDQWGQEFLCEGRRRRTDLRRFDKFTQGQWWFFGRATDDGFSYPAKRDRKYEWYPLPASALTVNPGLRQNPNY